MIRINLIGEADFRDNSGLLQVTAFVASIVVLCCVFVFMKSAISTEIQELTSEKEVLDLQLERLKEKTVKVRDLEKKRKDLKSKLTVIARLKKSKSGPVRLLDDLNGSLPERSWVRSVKEKNGLLSVVGLALDNQTIASFMTELEKSSYFQTVDLIEARTARYEDVKMRKFTISSKISYVGDLTNDTKGGSGAKKAAQAALTPQDLPVDLEQLKQQALSRE